MQQRLAALREMLPRTPLLTVLPAHADELAIEAVVRVSDDFLLQPVSAGELLGRARRMLGTHDEPERVRDRLLEQMAVSELVGRSATFLHAVAQLPRFAGSDLPVLVSGESGTGKELCARALHQLSQRRDQPFIAVDCGAIPELLLESELFGHVRGAFTGADRDRKGLVAVAERGMLFLDEVDALSPMAQAKLLRFLQEHTYRPVGSDRVLQANLKVVAATNRDLLQEVEAGRFRLDLYYRLNVLNVHLPPLREREGDVALLARRLVHGADGSHGPKTFTRAALEVLECHHWPGNVRELSNVVQRAAVTSESAWITPLHLRLASSAAGTESGAARAGSFREARAAALAAFERRYVEDLLRKHGGNVTQAAREAQQDRRAFGRCVKRHQIDRSAL